MIYQENHERDHWNGDSPIIQNETLDEIAPSTSQPPATDLHRSSFPPLPRHGQKDPGLPVLGLGDGPEGSSSVSPTPSSGSASGSSDQTLGDGASRSLVMNGHHLAEVESRLVGVGGDETPKETPRVSLEFIINSDAMAAPDADGLQATAAAAMDHTDGSPRATRVDSAQSTKDEDSQLLSGKRVDSAAADSTPATAGASVPDSITTSPNLSRYYSHVGERNAQPPVVSPDSTITSPQSRKESLPPLKDVVDMDEIAAQQSPPDQRAQAPSHQHKPSFSSATSQSPRLPFHPPSFPGSAQTSPISYHANSAMVRSPACNLGEAAFYPSPYAQGPATPYYATDRRSSSVAEGATGFPPRMPSLPSLPSASSSGDSLGRAGSSTDGISTAHTTPIDTSTFMEGRTLPPPPAMVPPGPFQCEFDGCTAAPFQTQYLLTSHKNVHSSSRPHYCPVKDCSRSEGGKGFKRKNEMIRHGLVHNSPGYICPFCPDREHRYPRPDNLQRHVRVHHTDKDKDDPMLREVLGQRPEGSAQKQRRRRTHTLPSGQLPPHRAPPAPPPDVVGGL